MKQHNPFNKQWHTISYYNRSGNFLGPAIFETEQEAQGYLEEYKKKLLVHLAAVNSNSITQNQQQQNKSNDHTNGNNNNNKIKISKKRRGKGRPSRNESIKLKVFEESTLPPVNRPSFFHRSN